MTIEEAPRHVGQVAMLLGIPRRRVQWWINRGFLQVEPDPGYRRGHYFRVSDDELRVARCVLKFQQEFGVRASATLFERMRHGNGGSENSAPQASGACS